MTEQTRLKTTNKIGRRVAVGSGIGLVVLIVTMAWTNRERVGRFYRLWTEFEKLGENPQGYREYRHRQTGVVFISLPEGAFVMGSSKEEREWAIEESVRAKPERSKTSLRELFASESPRHNVSLRSFLIAKYEVTQAQWARIMGDNPSRYFIGDELPVNNVSWRDCQEFCRKSGLSFATEAQWEYACRAGTETAFTFGDRVDTHEVNFSGDPHETITPDSLVPVESFRSNAFGLYNMHGNVEEWCEDVLDLKFYSNSQSGGLDPVPTRSRFSGFRIKRGGSRLDPSWHCRSSSRDTAPAGERTMWVGFRPAF